MWRCASGNSQIDVWALGVSLYAMVYGRLPFFDENDEFAMYEKIARHDAFLSSFRLRGTDENGLLTNSNKCSPELIEHEAVDGLLGDEEGDAAVGIVLEHALEHHSVDELRQNLISKNSFWTRQIYHIWGGKCRT